MKYRSRKKGWKFEVYVARLPNGKYPAKEYLESLDKRTKAKFDALIDNMAEVGYIRNRDKFKFLEEGFFEFKHTRPHHRIIGYFDRKVQGRIILTHGYQKQSNKMPRAEVNRAKYIRDEYEKQVNKSQKKED
ncbi:MAG: type II toxin-antitoxin system RelE/ParE family toxin [Deltaproteobacteria bacterium]|nr:type II toxin-antitoxin system RelE/ParE family toxin [Deltaproteobacteria bacterium]MBW2142292.1 type II toxin-antitoxin system RelE/ParE family toxin [Deltaproteobacteria bacterium]